MRRPAFFALRRVSPGNTTELLPSGLTQRVGRDEMGDQGLGLPGRFGVTRSSNVFATTITTSCDNTSTTLSTPTTSDGN